MGAPYSYLKAVSHCRGRKAIDGRGMGAKGWIGYSSLTVEVISAEQTSQIYFNPPSLPLTIFFRLITPMSLDEDSAALSGSEWEECARGDDLRLRGLVPELIMLAVHKRSELVSGQRCYELTEKNKQKDPGSERRGGPRHSNSSHTNGRSSAANHSASALSPEPSIIAGRQAAPLPQLGTRQLECVEVPRAVHQQSLRDI